MREEATQKRTSLIIGVLVVVALIAAAGCSGLAGYVSETFFSTQPYSSPSTQITAQVNTDGAMLITEQRAFTFKDKVTSLRWKHDALSSTSKISMRGMRVTTLDAQGNSIESVELTEVPFQESWRETNGFDGVGPGTPCYAIDDKYGMVYTYFEAQNATVVFTLDYTVTDCIQAWHDVAELNWTFLSSDWQMDSENVDVTLNLPVPNGFTATAGYNVHAWTHGPQNGSVTVASEGIVSYHSDVVKKGQWASLHLTFPPSWLSNLPDTAEARQYTNDMHLSTAISNEQDWLDQNNAGQVRGNWFDVALLVLCLVLLAVTVLVYVAAGRERRPARAGHLLDHAPDDLHPAVASRIMHWRRERTDDIVTAVMHLESVGAVAIESEVAPERASDDANDDDGTAGRGEEARVPAMRIVRLAGEGGLDDETDSATMEMLFGDVAGGADSVALADIAQLPETAPDAYVTALSKWNARLTHVVDEGGYFDGRSFKAQMIFLVLAVVLAIAGVAMKVAAGSNTLLGVGLPTALIMALVANYLPRRTRKGQDIAFDCQAYASWIEGHPEALAQGDGAATARIYAHVFRLEGEAVADAQPSWYRELCQAFSLSEHTVKGTPHEQPSKSKKPAFSLHRAR